MSFIFNKFLIILILFLGFNFYAQDSLYVMKEGSIDYRIALSDLDSIVFENTVEDEISYNLGDEGPAGGYIFYDKGEYSDGWRYLEVAPEDIGRAEWGCSGEEIASTSSSIGQGKLNTEQIISSCSQVGIAAKLCTAYSLNGFDDWFLPSSEELIEINDVIYANDIGNYKGGQSNYYFGSDDSSAFFANHVAFRNFSDALSNSTGKSAEDLVLPVRRF